MPGVYYVNATVYAGGDVPDDLDPLTISASTSLTITNGTSEEIMQHLLIQQ